jgi:hypothetical protein
MKVILKFILYHPQITSNLFTAVFFPGDHITHATSCTIAINPGKFDETDQLPVSLDKAVCGFINFDATTTDEEFSCLPLEPENPFLFFLGITKYIWNPKSCVDQPLLHNLHKLALEQQSLGNTEYDNLVNKYCDHVCACPQSLDEELFVKVHSTYNGCNFRATLEETDTFRGSPNFVQFALPPTYPLRCTVEELAWSDLYCLMFFLDLCTSLVQRDFTWRRSGGVKPVMPASSLSKKDETTFAIPLAFDLGRIWRTKIVLTSKKKKQAKQQGVLPSYQERYSKASFVALQVTFYEVVCLVDRLHHKLELNCGEEIDDHEDYAAFLKSRRPEISSDIPLLARFKKGVVIPDTAVHLFDSGSWNASKTQSMQPTAAVCLQKQ